MSRVYAPSDLKPSPWNVSPGLVAPQWRWVYNKLAFAFLYWNGEVVGLLKHARPNSSTSGNSAGVATPYGTGIDHSGRLEFDSFAPLNPGTGGVTMLTFCNANATDRQTLVCQRVGNQDNHLELRAGQRFSGDPPSTAVTEGSHLTFQCDDGSAVGAQGASTSGGSTAGPLDGDWHVLMGRRTAGGVTSVWSDGVDVTDFNQTDNTENINDTGTFALGGLPGTSTIAYQDDKLLDMGWNRGLSDAEMAQIGRAPFGPFRMERRTALLATQAPPSGLPIPIAMHHLRQQG